MLYFKKQTIWSKYLVSLNSEALWKYSLADYWSPPHPPLFSSVSCFPSGAEDVQRSSSAAPQQPSSRQANDQSQAVTSLSLPRRVRSSPIAHLPPSSAAPLQSM